MRDRALEELMERRRMNVRIAERCQISTAAVSQWRRVPKKHLEAVAAISGKSAADLRPDLFSKDDSPAA